MRFLAIPMVGPLLAGIAFGASPFAFAAAATKTPADKPPVETRPQTQAGVGSSCPGGNVGHHADLRPGAVPAGGPVGRGKRQLHSGDRKGASLGRRRALPTAPRREGLPGTAAGAMERVAAGLPLEPREPDARQAARSAMPMLRVPVADYVAAHVLAVAERRPGLAPAFTLRMGTVPPWRQRAVRPVRFCRTGAAAERGGQGDPGKSLVKTAGQPPVLRARADDLCLCPGHGPQASPWKSRSPRRSAWRGGTPIRPATAIVRWACPAGCGSPPSRWRRARCKCA